MLLNPALHWNDANWLWIICELSPLMTSKRVAFGTSKVSGSQDTGWQDTFPMDVVTSKGRTEVQGDDWQVMLNCLGSCNEERPLEFEDARQPTLHSIVIFWSTPILLRSSVMVETRTPFVSSCLSHLQDKGLHIWVAWPCLFAYLVQLFFRIFCAEDGQSFF